MNKYHELDHVRALNRLAADADKVGSRWLFRAVLAVLLGLSVLLLCTACNTVNGIGRDLQGISEGSRLDPAPPTPDR